MELATLEMLTASPTKANIEQWAKGIANVVLDGNINPLEARVSLKAMEEAVKSAGTKIESAVLSELEKHGKTATILGAKIDARETGVKYDYTQSEAWNALEAQILKLKAKQSAVEAIAKALPEGNTSHFTDEETGETLEIKRAVKTSKSSYAITLGK